MNPRGVLDIHHPLWETLPTSIKGWILLSFYGRWEGNVLHLDAETCNGQRIFSSPTSGSRTNVHVDPAPVWWLQSVKRTFRTTSFENNLEIKQIQTVIRAFSGILILIYIYHIIYIYTILVGSSWYLVFPVPGRPLRWTKISPFVLSDLEISWRGGPQ